MATLYIGLMSGTSLDGVDAALVEIEEDDGDRIDARLREFVTRPYAPEQRATIDAALAGGASQLCRLNVELGQWLADAALELLARAGIGSTAVAAIGSHGQTVWHEPPDGPARGATLQIGDAAVIAERTGIAVVSDFRARDVAAGGHGAPLVPAVDRMLFAARDRYRALQNIGGIANVTLLPPAGSDAPPIAFDTGPGVAVIDAVVERVTGGAHGFDVDGRLALAGTPSEPLLSRLLEDDYFRKPPPKTTGRERYGRPYADALVDLGSELGVGRPEDLVATATALTVHTIARAYRSFLVLPDHDAAREARAECVVSGGGARNPALMAMLARQLAPLPVDDLWALGWDPDAKEAAAFAVLAHLFRSGRPGNIPAVTGATGPRVLGKLSPP